MLRIKDFLSQEVKPALGCTEPGAVALAAARAMESLGGPVERAEIIVSDSIYKNGMSVGIPGTGGLRGNLIAAALGALAGHSEYGLEVLKDISGQDIQSAQTFIEEGRLLLKPDLDRHGVYVLATLFSGGDWVRCLLRDTHTGITRVERNGEILFEKVPGSASAGIDIPDLVSKMGYRELVSNVDALDEEDVDYIMEGVEMNLRIARFGFENHVGLGLGRSIREHSGEGFEGDLVAKVKAFSAAASDARMAGVPMPVMSSAGSGNHGITATLPVYLAGLHYGKPREDIARAVLFSHLSTSFVKSRMGRLSPVCGCAVAAGAGAAAGITWMLSGGDVDRAVHAMELLIGNLVGMICDGAKETCSLKVGTGAAEALQAATLALEGTALPVSQGVIDIDSIEQTICNAVTVNSEGMPDMDRVIIGFMRERLDGAKCRETVSPR